MTVPEINELTQQIIGAAIEVHKLLGPGLLEHTYQAALACELRMAGHEVATEVAIPFIYKGIRLDTAYRADLIVDNEVILELKATENDNLLFGKQPFTYLKLADKRVGLVINFNRIKLIEGVQRVVNSFYD